MSSSAYGDINKVHTEEDGQQFGYDTANHYAANNYMHQAMYRGGSVNPQPVEAMYPYMYAAADGRGGPPPTHNGASVWSSAAAGVPPSYNNPAAAAAMAASHQHGYPPPGHYASNEYYHGMMNLPPQYTAHTMMAASNSGYPNWSSTAPPSTHANSMPHPPPPTNGQGGYSTGGHSEMSPWSYKSSGIAGSNGAVSASSGSDLGQHSSQLLTTQQQRDYYYSQQQSYSSYRTPNVLDMMPGATAPGSTLSHTPGLDIHRASFQPSQTILSSVSEMGPNGCGQVSSNSLTSNSVQSIPQQQTNNSAMDPFMSGIDQSFSSFNIRGTTYNSGVNGVDEGLSSSSMTAPVSSISTGVSYNTSNGNSTAVCNDSNNRFSTSVMPNLSNSNNHAVTSSANILEVTNGPGTFLSSNNSNIGKPQSSNNSSHTAIPQKKTWANIASQPAKGSAATLGPNPSFQSYKKTPVNAGFGGAATYSSSNSRSNNAREKTGSWHDSSKNNSRGTSGSYHQNSSSTDSNANIGKSCATDDGVLDLVAFAKSINPKSFDISPKKARFFVIKSYSEDDIHRSIKYSIWCSTDHGNKKLDCAFKELAGSAPVYLFFSVNGSGHFCGMARMTSAVDYDIQAGVWSQDKWKGQFRVQWIYVKDVPNNHLRHIRLETNENKPVTNSRDATEVPLDKGKSVLKVIHSYKHTTSIFDDFLHYERREEQEGHKKN